MNFAIIFKYKLIYNPILILKDDDNDKGIIVVKLKKSGVKALLYQKRDETYDTLWWLKT